MPGEPQALACGVAALLWGLLPQGGAPGGNDGGQAAIPGTDGSRHTGPGSGAGWPSAEITLC